MDVVNWNKQLCVKYPYLLPRNELTDQLDDDYDYSYINGDELPEGWNKLFLQMCEDLRIQLQKESAIDNFRFVQIKEKYGELRTYTSSVSHEVNNILDRYTYISRFVCQNCGRPATWRTMGWISNFCDECGKNFAYNAEKIVFDPIMKATIYSNNEKHINQFDCTDIWRRLYD